MKKDNLLSLLVAVVLHLLLLFVLGLLVMRAVPPEEDQGVLVNFGQVDAAQGTFEPEATGNTPPQQSVQPAAPKVQPVKQEAITQDMEETVAIDNAKKKKEENERRERRVAEEAHRRQEAALKQQATDINNNVAGAFGRGAAQNANQGDAAQGRGNQGSPFGNADHGANQGQGGYGSFSLDGRSLSGNGILPRPEYNAQVEGRIVISITVNPRGEVVFADYDLKGTNIDNLAMRRSALNAAKRAHFNSISGTQNQTGSITYIYRLTE